MDCINLKPTRFLLQLIITVGVVQSAWCQDFCAAALRSDVLTSTSEQRVKLNELMTMSKDTYDLLKKSGNTSSNFGLDVVVPAIGALAASFDSSNSFNEYNEQRLQIQHTYNLSVDNYLATFNSQTVTSDASFSAFNKCVSDYLQSSNGVGVLIEHQTKLDIQVKIENREPRSITLTSLLSEGTVPGQAPGKLFADGKKLSGGGSLPVTVRRSGDRTVEFSIEAHPQYNVPTFYSKWVDPPPELLSADVDVQMPTETSLGVTNGQSIVTTNYNGNTSGGELVLTFNVTKPDYYIKNVDASCVELQHSGACQYFWSKDCHVNGSQLKATSGTCVLWTNSWPTKWTIRAEQFTTVPSATKTYQHVVILPGQEFSVAVPLDAVSAALHYKVHGSDVMLPLDESDKNLSLVSHFVQGNLSVYNYNALKLK